MKKSHIPVLFIPENAASQTPSSKPEGQTKCEGLSTNGAVSEKCGSSSLTYRRDAGKPNLKPAMKKGTAACLTVAFKDAGTSPEGSREGRRKGKSHGTGRARTLKPQTHTRRQALSQKKTEQKSGEIGYVFCFHQLFLSQCYIMVSLSLSQISCVYLPVTYRLLLNIMFCIILRRYLCRKYWLLWCRRVWGRILPSVARQYCVSCCIKRVLTAWHTLWWVECREWKLQIRADCHNRCIQVKG